MHWIADCLFFQQMLEGWGEVQRLGRYLGAKKCQEAKQAPFFTQSTALHPLKFINRH